MTFSGDACRVAGARGFDGMIQIMNDQGPKSSYELAMERLRKKDADEGIEHKPVTDQQRAAIAEVRNFYEAKLAERDVLHHSELARVGDPEARNLLKEAYHREREHLVSEREAKIDRIRRGEG
jgi:hypothetical protein